MIFYLGVWWTWSCQLSFSSQPLSTCGCCRTYLAVLGRQWPEVVVPAWTRAAAPWDEPRAVRCRAAAVPPVVPLFDPLGALLVGVNSGIKSRQLISKECFVVNCINIAINITKCMQNYTSFTSLFTDKQSDTHSVHCIALLTVITNYFARIQRSHLLWAMVANKMHQCIDFILDKTNCHNILANFWKKIKFLIWI